MWQLYFKKSITSYYFLAISIASLFLFWRLGILVVSNDLVSANTSILVWIISHRIDFLTPIFLAITSFGDVFILSAVSIVVLLYLIHRKVSYKIFIIVFGTSLAYIMTYLFKISTAISRPPTGIVFTDGYSFPSGHATLASAFFLAILFVLWPEIRNVKQKIFFSSATILLILLVAFSRMYLGVHWTSDCLGGILLGLFASTLSIYLYKKLAIMAQFDFSRNRDSMSDIKK